jgi:hypothetical protein
VKLVKGRWYWDPPDRLRRSHGIRTVSLGADQGTAWAAARKLNREHLTLRDDAPALGTVAWLLAAFNASERFERLAAKTQKDYRHLARVISGMELDGGMKLGRVAAAAVKPRHADGLFAKLRAERGLHTAHYACRFARRVWKWAGRRDLVGPVNPWAGMELPTLPQRYALWPPELVPTVVAAAEKAGRPSLGLATVLAYWLSHREGDVLSLTWEALDTQSRQTRKTGARIPVVTSAYPELDAAVSAARARAAALATAAAALPPNEREEALERARAAATWVVIHDGTGRAYNEHTFRHDWREIADAAGVPRELQFRDLRATAMTELADGGAGPMQLRTHGGQKTVQIQARYVRPTATQFKEAAKQRLRRREGGGNTE